MKHVRHEDDPAFDSVAVQLVERWKESELSGDEWRFSYVVAVGRKGSTYTCSFSRMKWALEFIARLHDGVPDGPDGVLGSGKYDEIVATLTANDAELCDQPGCRVPASHWFIRVKDWVDYAHDRAAKETADGQHYRKFCDRHRHRGDCGLDDADANYVPAAREAVQ